MQWQLNRSYTFNGRCHTCVYDSNNIFYMRTGLYIHISKLWNIRANETNDRPNETHFFRILDEFISIHRHLFTFSYSIFFLWFFELITIPNVICVTFDRPTCVLELHNLVMNLLHLFLHHSDVFLISTTERFGTWEFSYSFRIVTFI